MCSTAWKLQGGVIHTFPHCLNLRRWGHPPGVATHSLTHQELLARIESRTPNLEMVMEMFEEYNQLTATMSSTPALSGSMQLQALNARVLDALTRKALGACVTVANSMKG